MTAGARAGTLVALLLGCGCGFGVSLHPERTRDAGAPADQGANDDLPPSADLASSDSSVSPPFVVTLTIDDPTPVWYARKVRVTVSAAPAQDVARIELAVDAAVVEATSTPAPFELSVTAADNGVHQVIATAFDAADRSASSAPLSLVVDIRAPPPFVGAGSEATGDPVTSLSPGRPTSAIAGDLLLGFVAVGSKDPGAVTTPAGWTLLPGYPVLLDSGTLAAPNPFYQKGDHGLWIYSRRAASSEPSSYALAVAPASRARAVVLAYRGVASAGAIDAEAHATGYGSNQSIPTLSTTHNGCRELVIAVIGPTAAVLPTTSLALFPYTLATDRYLSGSQIGGLNLAIGDDEIPKAGPPYVPSYYVSRDAGMTDVMVPYIAAHLALAPE